MAGYAGFSYFCIQMNSSRLRFLALSFAMAVSALCGSAAAQVADSTIKPPAPVFQFPDTSQAPGPNALRLPPATAESRRKMLVYMYIEKRKDRFVVDSGGLKTATAYKLIPTYRRTSRALAIGVGFFGALYNGDLSKGKTPLHAAHAGIAAHLTLQGSHRFAPYIEYGYAKFTAQDRDLPAQQGVQPSTFVETSYHYLTGMFRVRFLKFSRIRPHISAGIGLYIFSAKDKNGQPLNESPNTRLPEEETYGKVAFMLPLSAGLAWRITDNAELSLDYMFQFPFTDYMDNVGMLGPAVGNDTFHQLKLSVSYSALKRLRNARSRNAGRD